MEKTLFVGIDISKKQFDTAALTNLKEKVSIAKTFPNNPGGFARLESWINERAKRLKVDSVHVCLEATGRYWEPLGRYLHKLEGIVVSVVNPSQPRKFADSMLVRTKTDRVDAKVLAMFTASNRPLPWEPEPEELMELKILIRHRDALGKDLTRCRNRLESYSFSGAEAKEVVSSLKNQESFLKEEIQRLEEKIKSHIENHPNLKAQKELLLTIPGVGESTAGELLCVIAPRLKSHTGRQIVALAGLDPKKVESGTSVKKRETISKKGISSFRTKLFYPAMAATRFNPTIRAFYLRLLENGKSRKLVIVACMRKLLLIAYGVLKNQKPFTVYPVKP